MKKLNMTIEYILSVKIGYKNIQLLYMILDCYIYYHILI